MVVLLSRALGKKEDIAHQIRCDFRKPARAASRVPTCFLDFRRLLNSGEVDERRRPQNPLLEV